MSYAIYWYMEVSKHLKFVWNQLPRLIDTTIEENLTRKGLHEMAYISNMSYVYGCLCCM